MAYSSLQALLLLFSYTVAAASIRSSENPGSYAGNILWSRDVGQARIAAPPQYLNFSIYNNLGDGNINMYVTGNDAASGDVVMLQPNGSFYFPNATQQDGVVPITGDVTIPVGGLGSVLNVPLPGYLESARIWFSNGTLNFYVVMDGETPPRLGIVQPVAGLNPNDATYNLNWGYMELSYGPDSTGSIIFVDISEVDFAGLPIGFSLYGCEEGVQQVPGLVSGAVVSICSDLQALPSGPGSAPWRDLCIIDSSGNPIRVISPGDLSTGSFDSFWAGYVDDVYEYYTEQPLSLFGQQGQNLGSCIVIDDQLTCVGYNRTFEKPVAKDIFGCNSGPFAITANDDNYVRAAVPILCAAFNRGTLLLPGGNVQPKLAPEYYYTNDINNYYSKFVHANAYNGTGYAFPYDDVTPNDEENESGTLVDTAPLLLAMTIGGPILPFVTAKPLANYNCATYSAPGALHTSSFPYYPLTEGPSCTAVPSSAAISYSPATPSQVAGYSYVGCWTDNSANRTLRHEASAINVTLASCAADCTYLGYSIFGVEYMYQCFCDNMLNPNASSCQVAQSKCSMACTADPTEHCGGPNLLNVYQMLPLSNTTTTSTIATSTVATSSSVIVVIPATSIPSTSRTRTTTSPTTSTKSTTNTSTTTSSGRSTSTSTTTSITTATSTSRSTSTSTSTSSTTTNTRSTTSTSSRSTTSSSRRSTISTSSSIAIINLTTSSTSTTTTSSSTVTSLNPTTTTTSTSTTPTSIIFGIGFIGCATDPMNGGGRALAGGALNSTNMSIENCLQFCQSAGLPLAGLEDGSECYCGSELSETSGSQMLFSNTTCDVKCSHNPNENCGGVQMLAVYYRNYDGSAVLEHEDLAM